MPLKSSGVELIVLDSLIKGISEGEMADNFDSIIWIAAFLVHYS